MKDYCVCLIQYILHLPIYYIRVRVHTASLGAQLLI